MFIPRRYPREFRDGALQQVRGGERPIARTAPDLGIAESRLRRWIKQAELDRDDRGDGLTTSEREELRGLRRENLPLNQDKEILRKRLPSLAREEIR